eukprot:17192-Heterococcus_DN1.PRE.2
MSVIAVHRSVVVCEKDSPWCTLVSGVYVSGAAAVVVVVGLVCSWECTAHCSRSIYTKHSNSSSEYTAAAVDELIRTERYSAQYSTLILLVTALAIKLLLVCTHSDMTDCLTIVLAIVVASALQAVSCSNAGVISFITQCCTVCTNSSSSINGASQQL